MRAAAASKVEYEPPSEVTQILGQIETGDGQAAEHLLPLICHELRKLATGTS